MDEAFPHEIIDLVLKSFGRLWNRDGAASCEQNGGMSKVHASLTLSLS